MAFSLADLARWFPNLGAGGCRVTSPATRGYNCIAWAAPPDDGGGRTRTVTGPTEGVPREETIAAFVAAFATEGYAICEAGDLEADFEKIAIYATTDVQRVQARNGVLFSYARLKAAKAAIKSGNEVVRAAEVALRGVRLEAAVGQRTVIDVLNAQQSLLDARVEPIGYQHDCIITSYAALAAIGRPDVDLLDIDVERFDAEPPLRTGQKLMDRLGDAGGTVSDGAVVNEML